MIGYEQNGHSYRLLDISSNSVFIGMHVIFDETAAGPPSSSPFAENIINTNNINNYTDTIVLTEAKTGGVGITNDDNIVMPLDDDSATSDDQYSDAEHRNGADGEEDDVDETDKEEEEEQEENIENNGEVNEMQALRRSDRVSQLVRQWWMVDTRNPVNYVFNVNDTPEDEHRPGR
jgi:hypothetical protein